LKYTVQNHLDNPTLHAIAEAQKAGGIAVALLMQNTLLTEIMH
jgi:hypothetical protein